MKSVLARSELDLLRRLAASNVLIAFDFDGTLAPVVADVDAARMRPATKLLLARVCALYPCAVVSGRARSDVIARLEGIAVRAVIGNHGIEDADVHGDDAYFVRRVRDALMPTIEKIEGVELEDKAFSVSIHHRKALDKRRARRMISRAVATLGFPSRIVRGKQVVNVLPLGAPDKGSALHALLEKEGREALIFVGDDVTDEDVFALRTTASLLGVRIGRSARSAASHCLPSQSSIDAFLALLIELRAHAAGGARSGGPGN